jgi:DNA replication and repair protein RecF
MVSLDDEAIEKNYLVNDKKTKRIPKKNIYPIVLFEPNDLFLFHGSPSKRRDYIDRFITQIDPQYTNILNRYEKALRQRNALLKQGITDTSKYFPWEVILSEYGASIVARRARLIEKINTLITKKYKTISNNKDVITIETHYTPLTYTSEQFLEDLSQSFNKDLIVKHTTVGPHRHDIYFKINNQPIEATASRGELRTTLLALKFIEAEIIEDIIKKKPIILLDDVFSELDEERQAQLLSLENQTIITTTEGYPAHQKRESNIKTIQLR